MSDIRVHGKTFDEIAELVCYAQDHNIEKLVSDMAILRRRCYQAEGLLEDFKRMLNETEL